MNIETRYETSYSVIVEPSLDVDKDACALLESKISAQIDESFQQIFQVDGPQEKVYLFNHKYPYQFMGILG